MHMRLAPTPSETDRLAAEIRRMIPSMPRAAAQCLGILDRKGFATDTAQWRLTAAKKRAGVISRRGKRRWYWTTPETEERRGFGRPSRDDVLADTRLRR